MKKQIALLKATAMALGVGASLACAIPAFTKAAPSPRKAPSKLDGVAARQATVQALSPRDAQSNPVVLVIPQSTESVPTPGIYTTTPYSSITRIVPENIDPKMVYNPNISGYRMPIHRPRLRFDKE